MAIVVVGALVIGGTGLGLVYVAFIRGAAGGAVANSAGASPSATMQMPVTADSRVLAGGGTQMFVDDFRDPNSGWFTGTAASGTTYACSSSGYTIAGMQSLHHLAFAPYTRGLTQMSITGVCATLPDGRTTRMVLFVNGNLVADASDSWSATLSRWVGGIVAVSRAGTVTTATFTKFLERDVSGGG